MQFPQYSDKSIIETGYNLIITIILEHITKIDQLVHYLKSFFTNI